MYYYMPLVGWFYRSRLEVLVELAGKRCRGEVLEVATGSGVLLPTLAPLSERLCALDVHPQMGAVHNLLEQEGVRATLVRASALMMPFPAASFDSLVCASMLEHLTDPGAAIDEMLRVLRPGGLLAVGFPVRNWWMDRFFNLAGYQVKHLHPSSHRDILDALDRRRLDYKTAAFPRWLPIDLALYVCCAISVPEAPVLDR
ncbi:MAG: class I SAM-dependent methyltransferase [Candidatus Riflebacteria bacterium]|nr:class I SAM-dependent methyltransferase [Candidatus Riflebacteria bacterium]